MWTLLNILLVIVCGTASETQLCEFQKSVALTNRTYAGLRFSSNETFVDPKTHQVRGCVCLKGTCARKCRPFGQAYNPSTYKCIDIAGTFDPPVTEMRNNEFEVKTGFNATKEFIFITGKMACDKSAREARLPVYPGSDFNLITNGSLYVEIPSRKSPKVKIYGPDKYCIDMFVSDNEEPHLNALICYIEEPKKKQYVKSRPRDYIILTSY